MVTSLPSFDPINYVFRPLCTDRQQIFHALVVDAVNIPDPWASRVELSPQLLKGRANITN